MGIQVAEYSYGFTEPGQLTDPVKVVELVSQIANGDFTIIGTPEELRSQVTAIPVRIDEQLPEWMNEVRAAQRELAQAILPDLKKMLRGPE